MMATRNVVQLRLGKEEKVNMKWAADKRGETISAWLRRLAREDYELAKAENLELIEHQEQHERVKAAAYPQGSAKCAHVTKGQFCYQCGKTRW